MSLNNFSLGFLGAKCTASFLERCITYIGEHATECVKTNSFLNLSKDAIIKLISSDYVSIQYTAVPVTNFIHPSELLYYLNRFKYAGL